MSRTTGLKKGLAGVVTGASTGIGRALAVLLAKQLKARLVLNARGAETLNEAADEVRAAGGQAIVVIGDIGQRDLAESLPARCLEEFGSLDIIVNNAGLAKPGPVESLTPDDWHRVFQVNFFAPLYLTYAALPHFREKGFGKIVNVASVAGKVAFPGSVCYAASKFALTGMSEGLAAELGRQGIDVITVCPGWVRSEFFTKNDVRDQKNPTLIAQQNSPAGWLMKYCLSISSEQCAREISNACRKGGGREIVLTGPGVLVERLAGVFPSLMQTLIARVPAGS
jgi:NAD(P)-dependent dehydrogenase (short-subunit alcohol dehydrogenase family)